MRTKDTQGLYFEGELVAKTYDKAVKELYQLEQIPNGFSVSRDHEAKGYSVVDKNGVQHIYELDNEMFYDEFMKLFEE